MPPARPRRGAQHGNDEQHVPHSVVNGGTLDDQKCQRQDDCQAHEENPALARQGQKRRPHGRFAIGPPMRFTHQSYRKANGTDERNRQQYQERLGKSGEQLFRDVGAR